MSDHIEWVLEMGIHSGCAGDIPALVSDMVAHTRANEPGALVYEYYLSPDKSRCTVIERYADSEAVMTHLMHFQDQFADRFFATFKPTRFTVYGPANDEVRAALSGMGATFEDKLNGFNR
jgi:quinol monooxygenase YgiN